MYQSNLSENNFAYEIGEYGIGNDFMLKLNMIVKFKSYMSTAYFDYAIKYLP